MKPSRYILSRKHNGHLIHYTGTGWTDVQRAAKRYTFEAEAVELATEMRPQWGEVYVRPI